MFLGAVFFIAMLIQRPVGISTQFSIAAGAIEKSLNPEIIYKTDENKSGYGSSNAYYNSGGGALAKDISSPINYETMFIVGVLLGSFLGSILSPEEKRKNLENSRDEGNSLGLYLRLFLGGVILLFGARMAGGCTSGYWKAIIVILGGLLGSYLFAQSYKFWDSMGLFKPVLGGKTTLFQISEKYPALLEIGPWGGIVVGVIFMGIAYLLPEKIQKN